MKFDLIRPCKICPFRQDRPGFLRGDRAAEIADALLGDQTFACHETIDYGRAEETGDGRTPDTQHCAGALIFLEHQEQPNQMMRWMERLGGYDRRKLDMEADVFDARETFIEHHDAGCRG